MLYLTPVPAPSRPIPLTAPKRCAGSESSAGELVGQSVVKWFMGRGGLKGQKRPFSGIIEVRSIATLYRPRLTAPPLLDAQSAWVDGGRRWYRVRYDDGDVEDMPLRELKKILVETIE